MTSPVRYETATRTYYIKPGTSIAVVTQIAEKAPVGATLLFEAGIHKLNETLVIRRGDITLRGAGEGKTTLVISHDKPEGIRFNGDTPQWQKMLTHDAVQGSKNLILPNGSNVKAGDVLGLHMQNDKSLREYGPYEIVEKSEYWKDKPLRESLVQVARVAGNVAYLKHEIAFDMSAGKTVLAKYNLLENVRVSDFTITYNLGAPKNDTVFDNPKNAYDKATAILINCTFGLEVENITVKDAASTGMIIRRALEPMVDDYTAQGAHNKGSDKNGYGLTIEEVFYGKFANLDLNDTRHSFLFSGWNAEAYNTIHIKSMNRDVNYHGGPDHGNTVLIDNADYLDGQDKNGKDKSWGLIDDGGYPNPPTDILQNVNLFKIALGSIRDEEIHGWDGGAYLNGREGDDLLVGGDAADVLIGGKGDDLVVGNGGQDIFVVNRGDACLTIADFKSGHNGDYLVFNGFGLKSTHTLNWIQKGDDVKVTFEGVTLILKNILLSHVKNSNILFNKGDLAALPVLPVTEENPSGGNKIVIGTRGADIIHGGKGKDSLNGREGDDALYGDRGNDGISGGVGNDRLYGGDGKDVLNGGFGRDWLVGGADADKFIVSCGSGKSVIKDFTLADGDALLLKDFSSAELKFVQLWRSGDDYRLLLKDGTEIVLLNMKLIHADATHFIQAITDNLVALDPVLNAGGIIPTGIGTDHDNVLAGVNAVDDIIFGRAGDDTIQGHNGNDRIYGEAGNDALYGQYGDDHLSGGSGMDTLYGGSGQDILKSGAGNDVLKGGAGNDILRGDSGADLLFGEGGADVFVFSDLSAHERYGIDVIQDFSLKQGDRIDLSDLLDHRFNHVCDDINDFVQLGNDGHGNSILAVDRDGAGNAYDFEMIAVLNNFKNADVDDLFNARIVLT